MVQDVFHDWTRSVALRSCQLMKLWNGRPVFLRVREREKEREGEREERERERVCVCVCVLTCPRW